MGPGRGPAATARRPLGRRARYAASMARYDLHLQPLAPSVQRARRRPIGFGYTPALAVSGFQAMMDQWMRIFLTAKGSDPCDRNMGTGAADLIGSTVSPENSLEILRSCMEDCSAQVRRFQATQLRKPATELLENAEMVRAEASAAGPGVAVWIRITNRAGTSEVVLLPNLVALSTAV